MKPHQTLLMIASLDGRLHPSRWTTSPDGDRRAWGNLYEKTHEALEVDGWIVGRVTMAEMTQAEPHPPATFALAPRPVHIARSGAKSYAIAVDPTGRLHFSAGGEVAGEHAVVLLGAGVSEAHLAELIADGVSYIVSRTAELDLAAVLETLNRDFGIARLALEGGGVVNGHFLAAGLVDEVIVLMAPALDGNASADSIIAHAGGLAGKVALSFESVTARGNGVVELRYRVPHPDHR